jgi:ankyrin repeat protein
MRIARPLPSAFHASGLVVGVGAFALALRFVWEQTVWTWQRGPQMVGFSLIHVHGGLFALGLLAALGVHLWLLSFAAVTAFRLAHGETNSRAVWAEFAALLIIAALFYIPYGAWKYATVQIAGPGPAATELLSYAVMDNQRYLVNTILAHGVPVDGRDYEHRTMLNVACRADHLDLARYLRTRGANVDLAPDCRRYPEFAAIMKPTSAPPVRTSNLPQVPGEVVDVH